MSGSLTIRSRLVIVLFFTVTIPILVSGFFMTDRAETALLNEKQNKLFGYARLLEKYLAGTYNDILRDHNALNADRATKIKIIHEALRDYTDQVALSHPGLGIGYYSKELDAILTYGPNNEFSNYIGQSIFPGHQGYTVMETGQEMVQIGDLVRGPIMNCMIPIIRDETVIGYIWSNELLSEIDAQIAKMEDRVYDTIIIGLFGAFVLSYFLTSNIARDVLTIKEGLGNLHKNMSYRFPPLPGEMGEISRAINEMSEALSNIKLHSENIAASTPNGLITVNQQGRLTIFNLAAERITGISAKDAIDKHYRDVFHPWPIIVNILDTALGGELYQNKELTIRTPRQSIPLLFTTTALINERNEHMGILIILRDLTETKKLEEQVRRADRLAITGELAAGVAHEVRNPLTAITGYLQLLTVELSYDDPRQEFTRIISKEIDRLNHLIEQLLYFSRPSPPQFLYTDLNKVIAETLLLINSPTVLKKVAITTNFSPELPPVKIDVVQFQQVLINIILNGIQAINNSGSLTLSTSYNHKTFYVRLDINDTGCGIPAENIPRIFDPFFTTKEKGTGLGLSVADKIMEVHQGYIEVESEPGKGTCFSVFLPVKAGGADND